MERSPVGFVGCVALKSIASGDEVLAVLGFLRRDVADGTDTELGFSSFLDDG